MGSLRLRALLIAGLSILLAISEPIRAVLTGVGAGPWP